MRVSLLLLFCLILSHLFAQESPVDVRILFTTDIDALPTDSVRQYSINKIIIEGNRKTKPAVIRRELGIQEGEARSLLLLCEQLVGSKNALMRSGLFRGVALSLVRKQAQSLDLVIQVEERWYLFPEPFITPVDYSFFEWVADKKRSVDRINYGVSIAHRNFTGHNDKLNVSFTNGFSRRIGLQYQGLFLDKAMKWSASFSVGYGKDRAVNVVGEDNRSIAVHTANNDFIRSYFNTYAEISFRPAIKTRHSFGIGLVEEKLKDTAMALSRGLMTQAQNLRYFTISYRMNYADVDLMAYPTKGRITELSAVRRNFGNNVALWQLSAKNSVTWPVRNRYIFNLQGAAVLKLPFDQPRISKALIGNGGLFMQGYEDYMIEGVAGGYIKASLARPLFGKTLYAPAKLVPSKFERFRAVPFMLYARAFVTGGYVHDPQPSTYSLSNRFLCSAGLGVDMIAFSDWVIKIEWSLNLLGQNGLYLHQHNSF